MTSFNLTARLNLQGPFGVKPVVDKLRRQVQSVTGNVGIKIDSSAIANVSALNKSLVSLESRLTNIASLSATANKNLSSLGSALSATGTQAQRQARGQANANAVLAKTAAGAAEAASEMEEFGRVSGLAIRRFAGFTIATGVIFGFINALRDATSEAISFERELAKVAQVSGVTLSNLSGLTSEITKLATGFGVSSSSLLTASRTLKQAGFTAREVQQSLSALAKTDLAPTFDSITTTTEGAIAVLRQFGLEATQLESVLGSINRVAGQFAVESGDIIAAIRRAGGVFSAAAGTEGTADAERSVREFIALFTSVRATTRETAESIAVGLRTVFSRLQRGTTLDALRELGIELVDLEGKFVGPFQAIEQLAGGLQNLDSTDVRFAAIVEELGGIRQIGKIIPLIKQFGTAQKALQEAQKGTSSLTEDAAVAQETLQNQIIKTRENFLALVRDISQTDTFQFLAKSALTFANSLISIASSLKPLIPLIAGLGAVKGIQAVTEFGRGFRRGVGSSGQSPAGDSRVTQQVAGLTQNTSAVVQNTTAERAGSAVARASGSAQAANVAATQANTAALNLSTASISKLAGLLASGGVSFALGQRRNKGGIIKGFNRGGMISGSSNSDTELIRAQPGEFMMNRKAVNNVGTDTLQFFNRGGSISRLREDLRDNFGQSSTLRPGSTGQVRNQNTGDELIERSNKPEQASDRARARSQTIDRVGNAQRTSAVFGAAFLRPSDFKSSLDGVAKINERDIAFRVEAGALRAGISEGIEEDILSGVVSTINEGSRQLSLASGASGSASVNAAFLKKFNVDNVIGNVFEGVIAKSSSEFGKNDAGATFDFPNGLGTVAKNFTNSKFLATNTTDAKGTVNKDALTSILTKVRTTISNEAGSLRGPEAFQPIAGFQNRLVRPSSGIGASRKRKGSSVKGATVTGSDDRKAKSANNILNPRNSKQEVSDDVLSALSDGQLSQAGSIKTFLAGRERTPELIREFLKRAIAKGNAKGAGGILKKFQFGGISNKNQPVALTPGELVFDPGATARAGVSALERFNKGGDSKIPGFNEGGGVSQVPGTGSSDTFFTSLPTGSFVVRKSVSEKAIAEGFNKGGRVGFGSGGSVRKRFVDGGGVPSFDDLQRRLRELDQNLQSLVKSAIQTAQEAGRSVSKTKQLNSGERSALTEARRPLLEERASIQSQIANPPRAARPVADPLRGGGGNNVINIPVPPRPDPFANPRRPNVEDLQRAQQEGAFDSPVPQFPQPPTGPATQRGDFLTNPEAVVANVLGVSSGSNPLSDLVKQGEIVRDRAKRPGDEFSDIASSRNAGFNAGAFDVSGSAARSSDQAFGDAAQDNSSIRDTLASVQKQETLAIIKKIKAEDASIGSLQAKAQAEKQLKDKYGVLAKEIDNDSRSTKVLNAAKKAYTNTLKRQEGESRLQQGRRVGGAVGRGAGAVGRGIGRAGGALGRGAGRIGAGLGGGNLTFAAFAAAPLIQGAIGQDTAENAATGAGISGALTGVTSGAATGAIFGPIGAALGGAVGGITAGITSAQSAFEETAKRIGEAEAAKAIEEFSKEIKELTENGSLSFDKLNKALNGLGDQVAENIKLEASTRGSFAEQGGFGGAVSLATGNAFSAARESGVGQTIENALKGFNIKLPEIPDFSASGILSGIGDISKNLDKTLKDNLGSTIGGIVGGPLLQATAFFARAQDRPESEADIAAFEAFAKTTAKELAGANKSLQEVGARAIEDALRGGSISAGNVSGLDDQAFLALGSASVKAQEAAILAAKGIDDESAATAKRLEVLTAEGKKLAVSEASRIQKEIELEKAIKNTTSAVDQSIARFDAIARAISFATTAGDRFRSQIALLNGDVADLNFNPISNVIDLISDAQFNTAQQGISSVVGDSPVAKELIGALGDIRQIRSLGPNIAAEVAARSSANGEAPEVALRQVLRESGIGGTGVEAALSKSLNDLFGKDRQGFDSPTTVVEGDVQKVIDALGSQYQEVLKAGDEIIKAQQTIASEITKTSTLYSDTIKSANDKLQSAADLNANRSLRLREITGEDISVGDIFRNLTDRVNVRTRRGGAGNLGARPGEIADEIRALRAQAVQLDRSRQAAGARGDGRALKDTTDALNKNSRQQESLEGALDLLSNDVSALTKVEAELANIQKQRDQGRGLLQQVAEATVDPAKAIELNRKIAAGVALLQGGPLAAGQIDLGADFLRQLAAITGQENQLNEVLDQRFAQILGNIGGFDAAEIRKFVETTVGKRGEEADLKNQFQQLTALQANALKQQAGLLQNTATAIERAGKGIIGEISRSFNQFLTRIPQVFRNIRAGRGFQTGGFVSGGPFVPGKDTIPAELQPGEFVVRRDVVKKKGVGKLLGNLNSGRVGFQNGGLVRDPLEIVGNLTPEEFAIQKNGDLRRLNFDFRGQAQDRFDRLTRNKGFFEGIIDAANKLRDSGRSSRISIKEDIKGLTSSLGLSGVADIRSGITAPGIFNQSGEISEIQGVLSAINKSQDAIAASRAALNSPTARRIRARDKFFNTPTSPERQAEVDASEARRRAQPTRIAGRTAEERAELFKQSAKAAKLAQERLDAGRAARAARLDGFTFDPDRTNKVLVKGQLQRLAFGLVDRAGFEKSLRDLNIDPSIVPAEKINAAIMKANPPPQAIPPVANVKDAVVQAKEELADANKNQFFGGRGNLNGRLDVQNRRRARQERVQRARGGLTKAEAIRQFNAEKFRQKARLGTRSYISAFRGTNGGGLDGFNSGGRFDGLFKRIGDPTGLGPSGRRQPIAPALRQLLFDGLDSDSVVAKRNAINLIRSEGISEATLSRAFGISQGNSGTGNVFDMVDFYKNAKGRKFKARGRNRQVSSFGDYLDFLDTNVKNIPVGFQNGGSVDTVPAMLQPGEFVVKRDVAMKNMPLLDRLNSGKVQGFAKGGMVGYQDGGPVVGGRSGGFAFTELVSPAAVSAMSGLSSAFTTFNTSSTQLATSMDNFAAVATNLNRVSDALSALRIPERIELQVAPIEVNATVSVLGSDENVELLKQGLEQVVEQRVRQAINNNIDPITGETSSNFVQ